MPRQARTVVRNVCTFDNICTAFMEDRKRRGLAESSLRYYADVFHWAAVQGFPHEVTTVSLATIESWVSSILASGMKPVTLNSKLRAIKGVMRYAAERGLLSEDLMESIHYVKHERPIIKTLTATQIKSLLHQCNDGTFAGVRDQALLLMLLDTGCRASELLGVSLHDLDVSRRSAVVLGKGRKGRRVWYSERTGVALDQYLIERGKLAHDVVFVSEYNAPFSKRALQDRLKELGYRAGIKDVRVSPHTLRHTFAKMYVQNGGDIFTLQKMLGHTTMDMVRNYVEMFSEDVAAAHAKFSPVDSLR